MATNDDRPRVLLVSFEFMEFFDDTYKPLIEALSEKAAVQRVKTANPAIRTLEQDPKAVLITDGGIANELGKYGRVWDAILAYVRRGGTAIVMGHFSSFVKPDNIKPFFAKAGLSWERGSYHRTTTTLNRTNAGPMADKLPASYSQKALSVSKVDPAHVWYASTAESVVESHVFAPTSAHTPSEAAVALAVVGDGKLAYLGDVNAEDGSNDAVLAMCGFL
ncbi:Triacylglycerol lipase [Mycena indigotica]|uniref:Triacylglycerol lipase n=1 Tax=Mycena indigotica TaxID=2126181 RepID=A0A8H6W302_9AGAR|nr:Triacylglycerol lipase [Mycena indigotica]KAF7301006.1 Triacylglycerol lipase [Mycena indigotica]